MMVMVRLGISGAANAPITLIRVCMCIPERAPVAKAAAPLSPIITLVAVSLLVVMVVRACTSVGISSAASSTGTRTVPTTAAAPTAIAATGRRPLISVAGTHITPIWWCVTRLGARSRCRWCCYNSLATTRGLKWAVIARRSWYRGCQWSWLGM